ncbi:hypothetical protein [Sphingomonas flavalba]|uniref:hypothetical protein n=1 Tax=Sphingomonas flavalba TaxID=2559804 RepID=UPI00109D99B8|nr:hypothetical protein [Sphingomonas flavalba]
MSASFDDRGQQICSTVRMNPAVFGALSADACAQGAQGASGQDRITRDSYDAAGRLLQVQKAYGTPPQLRRLLHSGVDQLGDTSIPARHRWCSSAPPPRSRYENSRMVGARRSPELTGL